MKAYKKFMIIAVALLAAILLATLCACDPEAQTAEPTPEHTHTFAEGWTHNDEYHWHAATCGHADETKDKAKHQLSWETTTPATCGTKGVQTGSCVCGYSETRSIDFAEHSWGKWTSNDDKTHTRTCSNNSAHTETKPCSFDSVVTPPSCKAQGYTTYTCKDCGYSYTSDPTTKTDHTYGSDGTCTECGAPDPSHSTEVTDAEILQALQANKEFSEKLFKKSSLATSVKTDYKNVMSEFWYLLSSTDEKNVVAFEYSFYYKRSDTETRYELLYVQFNTPLPKTSLINMAFQDTDYTVTRKYKISYNPAIQDDPYLKTVKEEILEYLHYDKQNVISYIIQGGSTFTSQAYTVIIVKDNLIDEFVISRENDTGAYSTLNEKHVSITGRKLVA